MPSPEFDDFESFVSTRGRRRAEEPSSFESPFDDDPSDAVCFAAAGAPAAADGPAAPAPLWAKLGGGGIWRRARFATCDMRSSIARISTRRAARSWPWSSATESHSARMCCWAPASSSSFAKETSLPGIAVPEEVAPPPPRSRLPSRDDDDERLACFEAARWIFSRSSGRPRWNWACCQTAATSRHDSFGSRVKP